MEAVVEKQAGTQNNRMLVIIGLIIGLIFSELDEQVVATAMPTIIRDLGGLSMYGWVSGVYMLTMTAFMPITGKLADLYGRRVVYLCCMGLFIGGSIFSGLSLSMPMLIIGRGIQGMGAGGLMPLAMTISGDLFPVEQRAKLQAFMGPIMFVPILLGPLMGGFFVEHASWHWIFFINIPVGLIAAAFIAMGLRESKGVANPSIDWFGSFLLISAIVSMLITPVLVENQGYTWHSPLIIGLLVLGAVLTGIFIWVESKVKEPIIPLHLFKNRNVAVMSLLLFTVGMGLMGSFSAFPLYSQTVLGLSPTKAGYMFLPLMIGLMAMAIVCSFFITKVRYRELFAFSFLVPIVGFYLFTTVTVETSIITIIAYFFVIGLGMGPMFGGDNLIVQESVDKENAGTALATVQLFQALGMTVGVSVFGNILASSITDKMAGIASKLPSNMSPDMKTLLGGAKLPAEIATQVKTIIVESFTHIYSMAFIMAIVAFVICWFLKKEVLSVKKEDEKEKVEVSSL